MRRHPIPFDLDLNLETIMNTRINQTSNTQTNISRRRFVLTLAAGAVTAVTTLAVPFAMPGWAHEADCPVCSLPVVQDTDKQDNEVKLRYGRKRIEYRCVYCAMSDAQSELKDG